VWFVGGAIVSGAALILAALVVLAGLARGYSFFTKKSIRDAPVWDWAGEIASGAAAVAGGLAVAAIFWYGLVGASRRVLRDVGASVVEAETDDTRLRRLVNVVDALALGMGVSRPTLAVIDDPAPNAISTRRWSSRTLAVTTGLLDLPRAELEAVCAHEMAHLHASDSHWITAATATVAASRGLSEVVLVIGGLLVVLGFYTDLWSVLAVGIGLAIVGGLAVYLAERTARRIRAEGDEVADVAAVLLARDPASLGAVCARLCLEPQRVTRTSARAEYLWFERVPGADDPGEWAAAELEARARAAYAEARVPFDWPPQTS
jgi:Zn-dependent protease with chaperone function